MLSNSDPKNTNENDLFFDELYDKFTIDRIMAPRSINSDGEGRGKIPEILVTNYWGEQNVHASISCILRQQ